MHRHFQILTDTYNKLVKMTIAPIILVLSPLLICATTYTLMILGTKIDALSLVALVTWFGIGLSHNFICFYFAVKVYKTSKSIVQKRTLFGYKQSNKWTSGYFTRLLKMYWRSFPQVRIYFWDGNYFDECTCLVILQFSVDIAINLILMDAK